MTYIKADVYAVARYHRTVKLLRGGTVPTTTLKAINGGLQSTGPATVFLLSNASVLLKLLGTNSVTYDLSLFNFVLLKQAYVRVEFNAEIGERNKDCMRDVQQKRR